MIRELRRDEFMALMVAELDAARHERGDVELVSLPDDDNDEDPTVELHARDAVGETVVEHTRIESYPGQVADAKTIYAIFPRGGPDLPERRADGSHHMLLIPRGLAALAGSKSRRRLFGEVITAWVRDHIDDVPWPHRPGLPIHVVGEHAEVPFKWGLARIFDPSIRLVGPLASVVRASISRPPELDELRLERLTTALIRKLPKLHAAAEGWRRSILVLEERDTTFSSPVDVSVTLARVRRTQLPDAIYMVHTRMGDPHAWVMYDDDLWSHDARSDRFGWLPFPTARCGHLNVMPVDWA